MRDVRFAGMPDVRDPAHGLRAATLNIWGLFGDWPKRRALLEHLLAQLDADLLLLQEVCADGETDQIDDLRAASGLGYAAVGRPPATSQPSEGVAVLSRWPLWDMRVESLPKSEPARCVLSARVRRPSADLWIVCAHTAFEPVSVREQQIRALAKPGGPVCLLGGDLNAQPDIVAPILQPAGYHDPLDAAQMTWPTDELTLRRAWRQRTGREITFDTSPRRLDYLLARGCEVTASGVIVPGEQRNGFASDHAVVWADIALL